MIWSSPGTWTAITPPNFSNNSGTALPESPNKTCGHCRVGARKCLAHISFGYISASGRRRVATGLRTDGLIRWRGTRMRYLSTTTSWLDGSCEPWGGAREAGRAVAHRGLQGDAGFRTRMHKITPGVAMLPALKRWDLWEAYGSGVTKRKMYPRFVSWITPLLSESYNYRFWYAPSKISFAYYSFICWVVRLSVLICPTSMF